MTDYFDVGDRPRSTYTIELEEELVDPPFVVLIVKNPTGEDVSIYGEDDQPYPITRDSEGVYYADIPCTEKGRWLRRWVSFDEDGVPLDAFEREFQVRRSSFTEPLPSVP